MANWNHAARGTVSSISPQFCMLTTCPFVIVCLSIRLTSRLSRKKDSLTTYNVPVTPIGPILASSIPSVLIKRLAS